MRSKKKRSPKLTRLEKMTKGLMLSAEEVKSKFTVREVEGKGRAIFLYSRMIRKDSFVLEYEGDVITHDEAVFREKIYDINDEGCYILFFRFKGRRLAIDATRRFDSYARYLNHSKEPNIRFHPPLMLDLTGKGVPRIAAYALKDIHDGEEIVFDYGVRDGKISWLQNRKRCHTSELTDSNDDASSSSSEDDEDGTASDRDVVMSIRRTPMKSPSNDSSISHKYKKTSCLTPSKYLTQRGASSVPPRLSIPSDGHVIRLIPLPSQPSKRKTYIGSVEGLGQPLKIMRSVEVRTMENKKSKSSQSVISLSASDDSSKLSPSPSSPLGHTDFGFPLNTEISSTSKVLEWQQTAEKHDSVTGIKILQVRSMREAAQASPSFSTSSSSYAVQNSTENSLPCITNIICGNLVPESFVPTIHSSSYENCKEKTLYSYDHTFTKETSNSSFSQQSPNRSYVYKSPLKNHTAHQTTASIYNQRGNVSVMKEQIPSNASQSFVKTSKQQVVPADITICLSDSDEDVLPLPSQNAVEPLNQNFPTSSFKPMAAQSKQSFAPTHMTHMPASGFDSQGLDKARSVSKVHDANDGIDIMASQNSFDLSDQPTLINHSPFVLSAQTKSTPWSNLKVNDRPRIQSTVEATTISKTSSYAPGCHSLSTNNMPIGPDKTQFQCEDETNMDDFKIEINDDQSDIEIISDGEDPSSASDYLDKKCVRPSSPECEVVPLSQHDPLPSTHRMIPDNNVPSHFESSRSRPQPHVAIVKPYSAETESECHKEEEVESAIGDDGLSEEEKMAMKQIFQPLIQSSDNLSLNSVERTITENFDFFNVIIQRGVSVNEIRRLVWTLFKKVSSKD